MVECLALFIALLLPQTVAPREAQADCIEVVVPIESDHLLNQAFRSGRLKLFFNRRGSKNHSEPADGPFFEDPQPLYSVSVQSLQAGQAIVIDAKSIFRILVAKFAEILVLAANGGQCKFCTN